MEEAMKPATHAPHATSRRTARLVALGGILAVLLGAVALLGSRQATQAGAVTVQSAMQSDFAGLVDIGGGRRLYLECRGQGSPTVVLEMGYRGSGRYWTDDLRQPRTPRTMVLPAVAGFTRVCAYDRPGTTAAPDEGDDDDVSISRSDAVPQPRTAPDMVADLHALLQAAGVPGPYVLAGHSLGGLFTRLYASTYPEEVVGLVLVDAYSERLETLMTPTQWRGLVRFNQESGHDTVEPIPGYGDLETVPYGAPNAVMRQAVAASPLRPMPLAVLAHGVPFAIPAPPEGFASGDELEAVLQAANADLATLVPNGRLVVADKSGHDIHQDQPELVIEAIRQVVAGVRHPDTWYDLVACCTR
jgi:pimeloyl-ACP methyl ester carboxylesterase